MKKPKSPSVPYRPPDDTEAQLARERDRKRLQRNLGVGSTIASPPGTAGGLTADTGGRSLGGA